MTIRTFRRGDEAAQVSIYNEAASGLPAFKPATLEEQSRRIRAREFDPATRFYAIENGQPVGYASFQANGRVSYPWCRPGFEHRAEALFEVICQALRDRGLAKAFAAYRGDWLPQSAFFTAHGFSIARQIESYILDPADMPTPGMKRSFPIFPAQAKDMPEVFALEPRAFRASSPEELEKCLLHNPFYPPESVQLLRQRADGEILAAWVLVLSPTYADPDKLDANMPCYRLGAFGSEGMTTKRVNGLFSFVARDSRDLTPISLDLLGHAAVKLDLAEGNWLAAQVGSDVPHLQRFYHQYFRKQGSFPVLEKAL